MESLSLNDQSLLLPQWMIELKDELECPVCLKTIMDPPIFLCENGHGLCGSCREDIKNRGQPCPVCRGALTEVRNHMVEQILDKLPRNKCIYNGCQFEKRNLDLVKKHEVECRHRLVSCGTCKKEIAVFSLTNHLSSVHQSTPVDFDLGVEKKLSCSLVDFSGNHQPLTCNGLEFYFNHFKHCENLVMFWISYTGGPDEADKYEYIVKIQSSEPQSDYFFTGSRRCVTCNVSQEDMKKEMTAVFIDNKLLQKAADGDGDVKYSLMVKRR